MLIRRESVNAIKNLKESILKKVEKEIIEVSGLDKLLEDVSINEKVSKKLTEKELLEFIWKNFNNESIKSKNGMLKHLRAEGLSCSMDRVFKMYLAVEKEMKKEAVAVDKAV